MDVASIVLLLSLSAPPPAGLDFDAPAQASRTHIDSPWLQEQILVAMSWPYRYGVTRMPCKARELQPLAGWHPAREPSGNIQWIAGNATRARWSGIYGTCFIESPVPRESTGAIEREALECECNGWRAEPVREIPLP